MISDIEEEIFIKQSINKIHSQEGNQSNKQDKVYGQSIKIQIKEKKQNRDKITEQKIKPDFYVLTSPHTTP